MAGDLEVSCSVAFGTGAEVAPSFCFPANPGEITALFGPSGCGKTTTLRMLAGLVRPSSGAVRFCGEVWSEASRGKFLPPQRRNIGFVFQNYALFPHLSVRQNLAYGIRAPDAASREARIREIAAMLEIGGLLDQMPASLSGGQAQRVGLGRALATAPRLLLLDEPLAALDEPLRYQIGGELRGLLRRCAIPVIMVSHDLREVAQLADRILLMDAGRILQQGAAGETMREPGSVRAAEILGFDNILPRAEAEAAGIVAENSAEGGFVAIAAEEVCVRNLNPPEKSGYRLARIESEAQTLRLEFDSPLPLVARITPQALAGVVLEEGKCFSLEIPPRAVRHLAR